MNRIILFFGLIALSINVLAFQPKEVMNEANNNYSKGEFAIAASKYQTIVDSGFVSADLYFNLGNAYFKSKNIKNAILYYERAKLLSPNNSDIDFNLEMARSFTIDKVEAMPELFFVTWTKWVRNLFSVDSWGVMCVVTFVFALSFLLLYLLSANIVLKKIGFWIGIVFVFFSLSFYGFGSQLKNTQTKRGTAIVFSPSVTAKSSPSESGNNLFVLHEGTKVEILDQVGEWNEIRLADGNRGWLKIVDIEKI